MTDFNVYIENQQFLLNIRQHKKETISPLQDRIVKCYDITDKRRLQDELDLYHLILKHGRGCDLEPSSACPAQHCFPQLEQMILRTFDFATVILEQQVTYSMLICLLDVVKNSPLSLSTEWLHQLLFSSYDLWQHEKIYMCRKSMELCKRIIPLLEKDDDRLLLPCIIKYIRNCRSNMSRADIERIQAHEYTEFFFTSTTNQQMTFDRECIKLLIQIVFKVFLYNSIHHEDYPIQTLITEIEGLCNRDPLKIKTLLFDICCANDDDTIQLLDIVLTIYQQNTQNIVSFLQSIDITPHTLFLFFLARCGDTHDIIIDLLLENDSEFLSFFHRYIMYALADAWSFHEAIDKEEKQETFLRILANTMLVLEGDGFPYNTKPLINRLGQLEDAIYASTDTIEDEEGL